MTDVAESITNAAEEVQKSGILHKYLWHPVAVADSWSSWLFSGGRDGRKETPKEELDSSETDSKSYSYSFCTDDGDVMEPLAEQDQADVLPLPPPTASQSLAQATPTIPTVGPSNAASSSQVNLGKSIVTSPASHHGSDSGSDKRAELEKHHDLSMTARSQTLASTRSMLNLTHSADVIQARETIRRVNLKHVMTTNVGKIVALGSETWMPLVTVPHASDFLSAGNGYFSFCCRSGDQLHPDVVEHVRAIVNLTGFQDERVENNVPIVNIDDMKEVGKLKFIAVKATYSLPGADPKAFTADLLSSVEYHRACQPGTPKIETKIELPAHTVRMTKTIIPWVLSVVIQLKVSEITDPATLKELAVIDGIVPCHAVLMERTKRDISKLDSTVKCKSVLLYYRVAPHSCIVTNFSIVITTALPSAAAHLVNSLGSRGVEEVRETMQKTRKFVIEKFGDQRPRRKSFRRTKSGKSFVKSDSTPDAHASG